MSLQENIAIVKKNIEEAQKLSKYNQSVELIAVTKTVESDVMNEALNYGITNIGENKVQEIQRKYDDIKELVNWHLIGTLQTNKVKYIADKVYMIHSLDRIELAKEIDKQAKKHNRVIACLIQVKLSEEDTKHGVEPDAVFELVKQVSQSYPNIKVSGLMGMAPYKENNEDARIYFKTLKQIFDKLSEMNLSNVDMKHLSMGMSNDYEIAIQEGATLVRVGTSIFGERNYN